MNIGVVIATYGEMRWNTLALGAARESVMDQLRPGDQIANRHHPSGTLAEARNAGARHLDTEWLCFLDADDELAPGYLDAMREAAAVCNVRALLIPRVQYVRGGRAERPRFPAWRPGADGDSLTDGNWLVIGTLIERDTFEEVGGFEEWPMYEDWALFARAWKAGAQLVQVPDAVYVAHRRPRSRNHAGGRRAMIEAHNAIRRAVFPELYEEGAMTAQRRGYDS